MDFYDGGDLFTQANRHGRFSMAEAKPMLAELALGLDHCHKMNIIHRDLKLENIMLDKAGHVCITDFGLSKQLDEANPRTNEVAGTYQYMPPEMFKTKISYSYAADWWSLG